MKEDLTSLLPKSNDGPSSEMVVSSQPVNATRLADIDDKLSAEDDSDTSASTSASSSIHSTPSTTMRPVTTNTAHERQGRVVPYVARLHLLPWHTFLLCVVLLCLPSPSWQDQSLEQRSLTRLTSSQIATLAASPDPIKNLDSQNAKSHLSKILIPRPRE